MIELVQSRYAEAARSVLNLESASDCGCGPSCCTPAGQAATPASGFTLGMRAAMMALRRVFRRFFVPYQAAS
jgi:hypothetical protein